MRGEECGERGAVAARGVAAMRGATRRGEDQSRRQAARVLTRGAAAVEKTIGIEVRRGGEARTAVIRGAARGAAATRGVEATNSTAAG